MQDKINSFFGKFFKKQKNVRRKRIQLFLVVLVFLLGILSFKTEEIKNFSAKIFLENFSKQAVTEEKNFLDLGDFLEKIKSGENKKLDELKKIYGIDFPIFGEILDEKVTQSGKKINFYFEATVGKGSSIHEFFYEGKISKKLTILEIFEKNEDGKNFQEMEF